MIDYPESDFQLLETILWKRRFHLLSEHMSRLEHSSKKLGFTFRQESIKDQLLGLEQSALTIGKSFKVRLLLSRNGKSSVEAQEITRQTRLVWNCATSALLTHSDNLFLCHKTTNRGFYDSELHKNKLLGYDEVLFCNERGEVTEGSITNILARINGAWVTPAVGCGLLPGVYRGNLLKRMKGKLREARISFKDLLGAERILLCNSVRGCIAVGKIDTTEGSVKS